MKVELQISVNYNDMERHTLLIDDKEVEYITDLSECPEDAHIGRDLVDGNDIIRYMKLAYEAGKAGEPLDIIYTDVNEEE